MQKVNYRIFLYEFHGYTLYLIRKGNLKPNELAKHRVHARGSRRRITNKERRLITTARPFGRVWPDQLHHHFLFIFNSTSSP